MRISDWSSDVVSSDLPDRTSIVADDVQLVGERTSPRASFADHTVTTPWDSQHIIYFSGYAIWTYLTTPFLFARPGFEVQEIDPWDGEGEVWRRLRVKFPPDVPSHSAEQTFYFGPDGVLRRHDYSVEIMGVFGGTSSANYALKPREFDGLVYPTQRRVSGSARTTCRFATMCSFRSISTTSRLPEGALPCPIPHFLRRSRSALPTLSIASSWRR